MMRQPCTGWTLQNLQLTVLNPLCFRREPLVKFLRLFLVHKIAGRRMIARMYPGQTAGRQLLHKEIRYLRTGRFLGIINAQRPAGDKAGWAVSSAVSKRIKDLFCMMVSS